MGTMSWVIKEYGVYFFLTITGFHFYYNSSARVSWLLYQTMCYTIMVVGMSHGKKVLNTEKLMNI